MTKEIRNCEFTFKCPKLWASLALTSNDGVRFCQECQRSVIFCRTASELERAIINNDCVAVEISGHIGPELFLGEPRGPKYETD